MSAPLKAHVDTMEATNCIQLVSNLESLERILHPNVSIHENTSQGTFHLKILNQKSPHLHYLTFAMYIMKHFVGQEATSVRDGLLLNIANNTN